LTTTLKVFDAKDFDLLAEEINELNAKLSAMERRVTVLEAAVIALGGTLGETETLDCNGPRTVEED
jgi:hypothetical protein